MYPFSAVVGQQKLKKALLLQLVDPSLGGVLLCGKKGTAKSTLARGLQDLCLDVPFVELPLNVTEDRLLGGLDITRAVQQGQKRMQPGLLAQCDGGILYADEINLLPRHMAKLLLDAAAFGAYIIEREGLSLKIPSRFVLLGSMNPEEGGLSPQLLDRFAFFVKVDSEMEKDKRMEIIRRRLAYEQDPAGFAEHYSLPQQALRQRICEARVRLGAVQLAPEAEQLAVRLAAEAGCAGNRAELLLCKAARALAAWEGAAQSKERQVTEAAAWVLPHRMRQAAPEAATSASGHSPLPEDGESQSPQTEATSHVSAEDAPWQNEEDRPTYEEQLDLPGEVFEVGTWLREAMTPQKHAGVGRRSRVVSESKSGRTIKTRPGRPASGADLAVEATLRAAVLRGAGRGTGPKSSASGTCIKIRPEDLRLRVRQRRSGRHILFVVDASGSMGAKGRMRAVKGAVLSLLGDAYRNRDQVGLVAFRGQQAQLLLGFTRSVDLAQMRLAQLPTGGKTPLAEGLKLGLAVIRTERIRSGGILPVAVVLSDGRATWAQRGVPLQAALEAACRYPAQSIPAVVVDTEEGPFRLGLSAKLAHAMQADLVRIENLKAEDLAMLARH